MQNQRNRWHNSDRV